MKNNVPPSSPAGTFCTIPAASLDSQRHRSLHEHQPWVKVLTILGWRSCILQLGRSTPIRLGRSLPGPGPQGLGPGPKPRDPRPEPGRPVRKVSVAGAPILQSKSIVQKSSKALCGSAPFSQALIKAV